ncbi:MAG: MFS transporter [Flavobacteriales bacterium]
MKTYSKKKTQNAWAMYDWANSVYSLVITSAIFPIYYEASTKTTSLVYGEEVASNMVTFLGHEFVNTALIGYAGAFGFVLVSLLMPMFTGVADYLGRKRFFLRLFSTIGALGCIGLYFFNASEPEGLVGTIVMYVIALLGFWLSIVFYNSYLPEIAPPEEQDKLSARGFSFGYIGSVLLLSTILFLYLGGYMDVKLGFIMTGVWWLGFTQWSLYVLPAGASKKFIGTQVLSKGFKELRHVWKVMKNTVRLKRYTQAFFVYSIGVQTVMLVAAYFAAKEIDWPDDESKTMGLIVSILLIQLIAIPGAFVMSRMSAKMGNVRALIIVNVFWALLCLGAIMIHTPNEFYVMAGFVGFVMGGIQSLSRSTFSKFIPEVKDTASYFSFYDVSEKIGLAIGLFVFAYLEEVGTMNAEVSEGALSGMRLSIVSLVIFFVGGVFLLFRVPKNEVELTSEN